MCLRENKHVFVLSLKHISSVCRPCCLDVSLMSVESVPRGRIILQVQHSRVDSLIRAPCLKARCRRGLFFLLFLNPKPEGLGFTVNNKNKL